MVDVERDPYPLLKVSSCHFGSNEVIAAVGGVKIDTHSRKKRDFNLLITRRSSCLDPLALGGVRQEMIYFVLTSRRFYCTVLYFYFGLGALWDIS